MRVFWSVLTVMGALSATEASAANWNEGRYAPVGIVDQLERGTVWQQGVGEPELLALRQHNNQRTRARHRHDRRKRAFP